MTNSFQSKRPMTYYRFSTAAEAIRFAVEKVALQRGTSMEVNEERFDLAQIRELYESDNYPLERTTTEF